MRPPQLSLLGKSPMGSCCWGGTFLPVAVMSWTAYSDKSKRSCGGMPRNLRRQTPIGCQVVLNSMKSLIDTNHKWHFPCCI